MAFPAGVVVSEPLLVQEEVKVERMQLLQEADQILQAAAQPVDRPSHDHVEFPSRNVTAFS